LAGGNSAGQAYEGRIPVDPQTLQVGSLDLSFTTDGITLAEVPGLPPLVKGVLQGSGQIRGPLDTLAGDWQGAVAGLAGGRCGL
jgi:translocation and assembly module TamB